MSKMKPYLFLFTIGPVQSFIAQARKTQDLYAGSQLLADLTSCVLSFITITYRDNNVIIQYPFYNESGDSFCLDISKNEASYPNRVMLQVELEDDAKAQLFGNCIEKIIREAFVSTANRYIENVIPAAHKPTGICEQLQSFLEVYWVGAPYDQGKEDYSVKFKELESSLASVKNFRQIKQLHSTEIGRKCNVDGEYNVKFYRKSDGEEKKSHKDLQHKKLFSNDNFIIGHKYRQVKLRHIQPGEGLSAISFFKRLYRSKDDRHQNFPSTAAIATLNLRNEIQDKIEDFEKCFDKDTYDEQLLFEDNLNENYFEKQGIKAREGLKGLNADAFWQKVKTSHKGITKVVGEKNLTFTKYYALIRFDGDSIGSKIAKATSPKQHREFSELLLQFAKKAAKVLDGKTYSTFRGDDVFVDGISDYHRGQTVYAGGDDFIGFVCLEYLFETIQYIRDLYEKEVSNKAKSIFNSSDDYTLSMGVVIAHYKTPLNEVVKTSKALEKDAKKFRKEKDCTGISFMTTTNTLAETYFPNEYWSTLELLTKHLKQKDLSTKFIFSFAREMALLDAAYERSTFSALLTAQQKELRRLMYRASTNSFRKQKEFEELYNTTNSFFKENTKEVARNEKQIILPNFTSFLKVAEKLSAELKIKKDETIPENTTI